MIYHKSLVTFQCIYGILFDLTYVANISFFNVLPKSSEKFMIQATLNAFDPPKIHFHGHQYIFIA